MTGQGGALDYRATVASARLNDDVRVSIANDGVNLTTLFTPVFLAFADIVAIERVGYTCVLTTRDDRFTLSRLGNLLDAFCLEAGEAFNRAVRRALFVAGEASFAADGDVEYAEPSAQARGPGRIEVYDDSVCLLPLDERARRVPFAFMTDFERAPFEVTLALDAGERYRVGRLGGALDAFVACVQDNLHRYRENALAAVRELDPTLDTGQLTALATLMPEGVAVPLGRVSQIAPSCAAAIEARIAESRAAETYAVLKQLCPPGAIAVGMKTNLAGEQADNLLWFAAPSTDGSVVAVEFAVAEGVAAATFLYRTGRDAGAFMGTLNRALEGVAFHRDVISLPEEQLRTAAQGTYAMAAVRLPALRIVRASFAGRVIHTSLPTWQADIERALAGVPAAA